GEPWNILAAGIEPLDLLISRWKRARCHGDAYLAVGDGHAMAQVDYLPDVRRLSEAEVRRVHEEVFLELVCDSEGQPVGGAPPRSPPTSTTTSASSAA
ncbi:unnamed protein product, partial [Prorocentrum cordatum]